METRDTRDGDEQAASKVTTVAGAVLLEFFDALGKLEGLEEAAPKLRAVVLDDGVFAEAAIRAALFGDEA
ncbi:MAG: hypothetical protein ACRYHQ_06970 [Janthinobacterium lividum]